MSKVLLVEDSLTQATQIQSILEESSHQVVHVSDGHAALAKLLEFEPDVVVTDLQMPEINGLELVERLQQDHPTIPAILVTGRGSEQLAVDALRRGAAGYVPKSMLSPLLVETIENVLGVMRAEQSYSTLIDCLQKNSFSFNLPSSPSLISPLVDLVLQVVAGMQLFRGIEIVRLSTSMENALENAIYHGNLELTAQELEACRETLIEGIEPNVVVERREQPKYRDRRIHVDVEVSRQEIHFTVEDDGDGFDTSIVPDANDSEAINEEHRRGLVLMASFVDELKFNQKGNRVTLVKRRKQESKRP